MGKKMGVGPIEALEILKAQAHFDATGEGGNLRPFVWWVEFHYPEVSEQYALDTMPTKKPAKADKDK